MKQMVAAVAGSRVPPFSGAQAGLPWFWMLILYFALTVQQLAIGAEPAAAAATATPEAQQERFDILEIRVLGNSVIAAADIERVVYPSLGPQRSLADVEVAREALAQLYRAGGYGAVTVDIPEQDVVQGIVRMKVTEGRIDRLRVTGGRYFANGQIRSAMSSVERGRVLSIPSLQEDLAALNRQTADRTVTPVLRAGRTPGTVDLELKVADEVPFHGNVEVTDRYTADTSRLRAGVNLSYGNLFQRFHSLSFQYQTAPEEPEETRVLAATYVAPFASTGHSLAVYAVDTDSDVATIGTLSVLGAGQIFGARYIIPMPAASGGYSHSFVAGVDYKDFKESIRLTDATDTTPIDYVNWSAMYSASARSATTSTGFGLTANFGIRGVANESGPAQSAASGLVAPGEFGYKRFNAKPNYFYLRAQAQHERPLLFGTRVALRVSGQYVTEPLISNEQFSIGGAESVRGYLESEELGDLGASGSLEFLSPVLMGNAWGGPLGFHALAFLDAGVVTLVDPLPQQVDRFTLSSAGAGLRFTGFDGLEAAVDWAYPFKSTNSVIARDARLHFRVYYGF